MNEYVIGAEHEPGEVLALATAIAHRDNAEQKRQKDVMAEITPMAPELPIEVSESLQIGATVAMLQFLEDPEMTFEPESLLKTVCDDQAIANLIRAFAEEPDDETVEMIRNLIGLQMRTIWDQFVSDPDQQHGVQKFLGAANAFAHDHDVSVTEVYLSDELYEECMRSSNTPEEYVTEYVRYIEKFDINFISKVVENTIQTILGVEVARGDMTQVEYETEKTVLMEEFFSDEEAMIELNLSLADIHRAAINVLERQVTRFWGEAPLIQCRAIIEQSGIHETTASTLSKSMLKVQKQNAIYNDICAENGWDPATLTVEQHSYIQSSAPMQALMDED